MQRKVGEKGGGRALRTLWTASDNIQRQEILSLGPIVRRGPIEKKKRISEEKQARGTMAAVVSILEMSQFSIYKHVAPTYSTISS